jgi:cyanophycin synthetase
MHLKPASGKAQPVGEAITDHLFPPNVDFRIPIIGISGSKGRTITAEMVAHFARLTNVHVGLSSSKDLYFGSRLIHRTSKSNWENGRRTLQNRAIEFAVIENDNASLLLEGLSYDQCQVGIVLNIDPQGLFPEHNISDDEQLFNVVRTQVDVVLPTGICVLNADDPMITKMAELSKGEVMYFSEDPYSAVITEHQQKKGRSIIATPKAITLMQGAIQTKVIPVPPSIQNRPKSEWMPHLSLAAAIGAAWALDIPLNIIQAGVETFVPNTKNTTEV